jgi:hypothetical protein
MSEQPDKWRMTLPKGMFFENPCGDDALKAAELARIVPSTAVVVEIPAGPQSDASPEPPAVVLPLDELSAALVESEASTADAPVVEPVAPPADAPVIVS